VTARVRLVLLALAFVLLAPAVWRIATALPSFGTPESLYGPAVNALVPAARHVSNMVGAVNFDLRGIDTLGEEFMLIAAVTGAVVLLRGSRGEDPSDRAGRLPGRPTAERADATVVACRIAATVTLLFGLYMGLHGTATPGGGFQGGVVAASSLLLLYLGEGYETWRALVRAPVLAAMEGGGGLLFVLAAAGSLLFGQPALSNLLPLGEARDLFSGGLMVVVNAAVLLAVTGSFGLLLLEIMEETRAPEDDPVPDEEKR
jgi:multicomponent Na+:H+ antiporter subunit B